ncbi:MAG TPA: hypothetical protein VK578_16805 [Edaphobacter sp.]|jgi:hypothetical protein|nr:hypothetical protein [Edaphobacter sp.]
MTSNAATKPSFKEKAKRELINYAVISAYLAVFFCALATYTTLLLRKYDISDDALNYTFAIINALVIGKVILIGKMFNLGRSAEDRPLYQTVLLKSVFFGLLVFGFHLLEEFIKRLIHGEPAGTVWHNMNYEDLIGRSVLIFVAFIPLFAFIELRRLIGEEKLHAMCFHHKTATSPGLSATD